MVSSLEQQQQPIERPDLWKAPLAERLTRERANEVVMDLLDTATPILADMVDRGIGRKTAKQDVPGREEDEELEIDSMAESLEIEILEDSAKTNDLSFTILSEHNNYTVGAGEPNCIISLDPFDNSDEYKKGLDIPPHITLAIYGLDLKPIAAGDANLFIQHLYVNRDGKNYFLNPRQHSLTEIPIPPEIKSIEDPSFVIASYPGRDKYSRKFNMYLDELNRNRFDKSTFHGKGGTHLYPYMAKGSVSAYAMFDEPRGEIDPGAPFALSAGYNLNIVHSDGSIEPYKFDPTRQRETVPFFLAASTLELRDEIVAIAMAAKKKLKRSEW